MMRKTVCIPAAAVLVLIGLLGTSTAFAQPCNVLSQCVAPISGNGRGLAWDGTNLYYSLSGGTVVHVTTTGCGFLGTLTPTCPDGTLVSRPVGALAYDPGANTLWVGTYDGAPAILYEMDLAGNVLQTIGGLPGDGPFPTYLDGLAYDGSTLFYSTDLGLTVFAVSASGGAGCTAAPAVVVPGEGYASTYGGDLSGHAWDGVDLWTAQPTDGFSGGPNTFPAPQILLTPTNMSTVLANCSTAPIGCEDLAWDPDTFDPDCAVWCNEATFAGNRLTAFQAECPIICPDPDPRSQGFWHRQCLGLPSGDPDCPGIDPGRNGRGPKSPTLDNFCPDLFDCGSTRLEDLGFFGTDTCEGMDADPPSDKCEKALKQLTALVLNVCNGLLADTCEVDASSEGCSSTTVGDLIDEIAGLIQSGDCNTANACAAFVNEGGGLPSDGGGSSALPDPSTNPGIPQPAELEVSDPGEEDPEQGVRKPRKPGGRRNGRTRAR